jgi:membrane protease YdiL (CAAX protease family)
MRTIGFLTTFLVAWFALDRLVPSPMAPIPALVALAAAVAVLAIGERVVYRTAPRSIPVALGFGRPVGRALVAAGGVSLAAIAALIGGAALLGIPLELRAGWPMALLGVLIFHGLAEETVWRGFAFAHLRSGRTFRQAVLFAMPLIALTHVPIVLSNGPLVGGLAMVSAAVTCLPLAYLWERGGRTIWAPALVHASVDLWQLLTPGFPMQLSLVVLVISIVVPLLAFVFGDRFFDRAPALAPAPAIDPATA